MPIYELESHCPLCDEVVDIFADHGLICSCGGDRVKRHNLLRNEVFFFCNSAGLNPELERPGLLQPRPAVGVRQEDGTHSDNNNRRPADIYLPRWRRGGPAALDFVVMLSTGQPRMVLQPQRTTRNLRDHIWTQK